MNKFIIFYFCLFISVQTTLAKVKHSIPRHLFHSNRSKGTGKTPIVYHTADGIDNLNDTEIGCGINIPNLPCHLGDNQCIEDALNNLIRLYPKGYRPAKFPSIEPFHLNRFNLLDDRNTEEGWRIDLNSNNLNYTGIGNSSFSVRGFKEDVNECIVRINFFLPKFIIDADYTLRLLFHNRNSYGKGKYQFTFDDLTFVITFEPKIYKNETDGKHYLALHNFLVDYIVKEGKLNFGDLFDGDQDASKHEHEYLNSNILSFVNDTRFSAVPEFSSIFLHLINPMIESNSIDRIFILDSLM